jgi:hypothetical protein
MIMPRGKPPINLAGTLPRDMRGLTAIFAALLEDPRAERTAIIKFRNTDTGIAHPDGEDNQERCVVTVLELVPVTEAADVDQLDAMSARAKLTWPGQGTLDEFDPDSGGNGIGAGDERINRAT